VFALLAVSDALDSASPADAPDPASHDEAGEWLRRAAHLALLGSEWPRLTEAGGMNVPDRRWSLYEGVAGMCCAYGAVLARLRGGKRLGMVGYDDLV
jgi:hypothetical protein